MPSLPFAHCMNCGADVRSASAQSWPQRKIDIKRRLPAFSSARSTPFQPRSSHPPKTHGSSAKPCSSPATRSFEFEHAVECFVFAVSGVVCKSLRENLRASSIEIVRSPRRPRAGAETTLNIDSEAALIRDSELFPICRDPDQIGPKRGRKKKGAARGVETSRHANTNTKHQANKSARREQ